MIRAQNWNQIHCCCQLPNTLTFIVNLDCCKLFNFTVLIYHLSNGALVLSSGKDIFDIGSKVPKGRQDGVKAALNFLAALISTIRIYYGLKTIWSKYDRLVLENYFFSVFTVNIYDSIEFVMKMIVDYSHAKIAGLIIFILILWYCTQVTYSFLAETDDDFRFQSQRKKDILKNTSLNNPK